MEFNKLVYDWQNNQHAEELCCNYLKDFELYEIKDSPVFKKQYKKLILCQAYNETEFMEGFLEDMAKYFDGIILLDDGSTDHTWELARHEKLLLKVKKKREYFNDLENRNILLDLASFFKSKWFCFMDIDERFDERYVNFETFEDDQNVDVVAFRYVDLWDSDTTYNTSLFGSQKGIYRRMRMFRSIGHMQIRTFKKKLHFAAVPHRNNIFESMVLFKHFGNLDPELRAKKYHRYRIEDAYSDQSDYSDLLKNGNTRNVEDLTLSEIEQNCKLYEIYPSS